MGLVYTAITAWLGFIPHCDEGKTMGLAPYGNYKRYNNIFKKIIRIEKFGKISVNFDYFNYPSFLWFSFFNISMISPLNFVPNWRAGSTVQPPRPTFAMSGLGP